MSLRSEIRFSSGFADDAVYGADEFCEVQGGRNIAETLKVALERLNYRVSDPIDGGITGGSWISGPGANAFGFR